jgi:hypothetical protein
LVHNPWDTLGAYTPKPSYVSYATLAKQLTGAHFVRQEAVATGVYDEVFAGSTGYEIGSPGNSPINDEANTVRVLWADNPTTVTVATQAPLAVTDLYGCGTTCTRRSPACTSGSICSTACYSPLAASSCSWWLPPAPDLPCPC